MVINGIQTRLGLLMVQKVIDGSATMTEFANWLWKVQHKFLLGIGRGMHFAYSAPNFLTHLRQIQAAPSDATFEQDFNMLFAEIAGGAAYKHEEMTSFANALVSRHARRPPGLRAAPIQALGGAGAAPKPVPASVRLIAQIKKCEYFHMQRDQANRDYTGCQAAMQAVREAMSKARKEWKAARETMTKARADLQANDGRSQSQLAALQEIVNTARIASVIAQKKLCKAKIRHIAVKANLRNIHKTLGSLHETSKELARAIERSMSPQPGAAGASSSGKRTGQS